MLSNKQEDLARSTFDLAEFEVNLGRAIVLSVDLFDFIEFDAFSKAMLGRFVLAVALKPTECLCLKVIRLLSAIKEIF